MRIEVGDIIEGQYYTDERCERLQALLKTEAEFDGYIVRRQHWYEEYDLDPFIIQDTSGEDMLTLEPWEVDALTGSEFLSYVDVQVNNDPQEISVNSVTILTVMFMVFPLVLILLNLEIAFPHRGISMMILVPTLLLILLYAIVSYKRWRNTTSHNLQLDLALVREDPMFLEALRKLAAVPKSEYMYKDEHVKRLRKIETALAGNEA